MKEITTGPNSIFISHDILQHTAAEWHGQYCRHYQLYLIPDYVLLRDKIAFAYSNTLNIAARCEEDNAKDDSSLEVPDTECSMSNNSHDMQGRAIRNNE